MSALKFFSLLLISTALVTEKICHGDEINHEDNSDMPIIANLTCWSLNEAVMCRNEFNITANLTENFSKDVEIDVDKNAKIARKFGERKVLQISRVNLMERLLKKIGLLFKSLEVLRASQVGLKAIVKEDFADMKMLRILVLSYNQLMKLPFDAFHNLKDLEKLSLEGNKIQSLHIAIFSELTSLKIISLAGNQIQTLEDVFQRNFLLEEIYLENNQLKNININFSNRTQLLLVNLKNNSEICVCKNVIKKKIVDYSSCDVSNAIRRNITNVAYQNCVFLEIKSDSTNGKEIMHCAGNFTQSQTEIESKFTKCTAANDKPNLTNFDYCLLNRLREEKDTFQKFDDCIDDELSKSADVEDLLRTCVDEIIAANEKSDAIYSRCTFCKPDNSTTSESSRVEKCDIEYNNSDVQTLSSFQDKILKYFRD